MVTSESFIEYRAVTITEPLRQGDVLESVSQTPTAWNRHLLVITADCDFAHHKHQGRVTCVPLLTKDEYLLELQVPKLWEQATVKLLGGLQNELRNLGAPNVTDERLRAWPQEQKTDEILTLLSVPEDRLGIVGGMIDAIRDLATQPTSLVEAANFWVTAQLRLPSPPSEKNLRTQIRERFRNIFKQTPGDALFLSALAEGHDHGYFAYLRHLEQIWEPQIALGPSRSPEGYRRVSHLQDKYTHAIAQRFALVFMSIGLPNAYEEMRDLHAELLGEDI